MVECNKLMYWEKFETLTLVCFNTMIGYQLFLRVWTLFLGEYFLVQWKPMNEFQIGYDLV